MPFNDALLITSTLLSPVIAVLVTLWWQNRKEKRDQKAQLFLKLMAHRKTWPPSVQWTDSLNTIDVVFFDDPKVLDLWHRHYEGLCNLSTMPNPQVVQHLYLEMLFEMAKTLGYKSLQQTDIDKFYSPQIHGNQAELSHKCQTEFLRVLENTAKFEVSPRVPEK